MLEIISNLNLIYIKVLTILVLQCQAWDSAMTIQFVRDLPTFIKLATSNLTDIPKDRTFPNSFLQTCDEPHVSCFDKNAICESGYCICRTGYFTNNLGRCQLFKIMLQLCNSDIECQAWDPSAYCDTSLSSAPSPYCDCRSGTIYDRRLNSCLPCSTTSHHEHSSFDSNGEDITLACPDSKNQTDPYRLKIPLEVLMGAITLFTIFTILWFFIRRLYYELKKIFNNYTRANARMLVTNDRVVVARFSTSTVISDRSRENRTTSNLTSNPPLLTTNIHDFTVNDGAMSPLDAPPFPPNDTTSVPRVSSWRFGANRNHRDHQFLSQSIVAPINPALVLLRAAIRSHDSSAALPTFDPPPKYDEAMATESAPFLLGRINGSEPVEAQINTTSIQQPLQIIIPSEASIIDEQQINGTSTCTLLMHGDSNNRPEIAENNEDRPSRNPPAYVWFTNERDSRRNRRNRRKSAL